MSETIRGWLGGMKVHPLADIFPMLADDEMAELAADIKANGLVHPIIRTVDGKTIVDGRNRKKACHIAGVEPVFDDRIASDDEAKAHITSGNLQRRNMTKGQQAMAMAMIYPEPERGKRTDLLGGRTSDVSRERLSRARWVLRHSPEMAQKVLAGKISIDQAAEKIRSERARPGLDALTLGSRLRDFYIPALIDNPDAAKLVAKHVTLRSRMMREDLTSKLPAIAALIHAVQAELAQPQPAGEPNGADELEIGEAMRSRVEDSGFVAGYERRARSSNPWTPGSPPARFWDEGWESGAATRAEDTKRKPGGGGRVANGRGDA